MKDHTYRTTDRRTCSICGRPPVAPFGTTNPETGEVYQYTIATHPLFLDDDIPVGEALAVAPGQ